MKTRFIVEFDSQEEYDEFLSKSEAYNKALDELETYKADYERNFNELKRMQKAYLDLEKVFSESSKYIFSLENKIQVLVDKTLSASLRIKNEI